MGCILFGFYVVVVLLCDLFHGFVDGVAHCLVSFFCGILHGLVSLVLGILNGLVDLIDSILHSFVGFVLGILCGLVGLIDGCVLRSNGISFYSSGSIFYGCFCIGGYFRYCIVDDVGQFCEVVFRHLLDLVCILLEECLNLVQIDFSFLFLSVFEGSLQSCSDIIQCF